MSEAAWRLLLDGKGETTGPMTAEQVAEWLWAHPEGVSRWAEPVDGGEGLFTEEVPAVRALLLRDPVRVAHLWLDGLLPNASNWAFEFVMELCQHNPEAAWPLVRKLVECAPESALPVVAAGPLEDLLALHGHVVIGLVEAHALSDTRFRDALSLVWRSSMSANVCDRVQAAARSGLDD
jgi:hypothetical protein